MSPDHIGKYRFVLNDNLSRDHFDTIKCAQDEADKVASDNDEEISIIQVMCHGKQSRLVWTDTPETCDYHAENRYGKPWTDEENKQLLYYCSVRKSIHNIVKRFGRTENAIMSQIRKQSYYHPHVRY